MTNARETVWVTQDVLDRLRQELDQLTASRLAGHEDRAQIDTRIRELEGLLRDAEVGSKPDDGLVEPGMKVTVRFDSDGSTQSFLLGARALLTIDPTIDIDVYSPSSPLGAAITGRYAGERVSYQAPGGAAVAVEILSTEPFQP